MKQLKIHSVSNYFRNAVLVQTFLILSKFLNLAVTLEKTLVQQRRSMDLGAETELLNSYRDDLIRNLNSYYHSSTFYECDIRYFNTLHYLNTPYSLRPQIPVTILFQRLAIRELLDYSRFKINFLSTEASRQSWTLPILQNLISRKDVYWE